MRKLFSIGLICVVLFNATGYLYILNWWQSEVERKADELIDTHASEISGNLIFRIPMNVPYNASMSEYTRVEGEIEFEGQPYRMVKQKVESGFLYVVCVKDERTRLATDEINEMIAMVSGQPAKGSTPFGVKVANLLLKYCPIASDPGSSNNGWSRQVIFFVVENNYRYDGTESLFHPPSEL